MLSKKRIKVMFQMASYEKEAGKNDLKTVRYYKNDFVRLNILRTIICMTFGYAIILGMAAMYHLEYIISNAVKLPYRSILFTVIGVYILLLIFYIFVTILVYSLRYDASKKRVQKYFRYLKYLQKQYQSDDAGEEE